MSTIAQMIGQAFGAGQRCLCAPEEVAVSTTRRRRRLWDLPHQYHCALIGTCLPVSEMRRLAPHSGYDVSAMSDYSLHVVVVGYCESRSELSKAIQRHFDKCYTRAIKRFEPATDRSAVLTLWRDALAAGDDVPGALWAAWTHPALDDDAGREIHGDIHMLSHQTGATVRADIRRLEQAQAEAARLRPENAALRHGLASQEQAQAKEVAELRKALASAEQRAAHFERRELELAAVAADARQLAALRDRAAALSDRAEALEERNAENARRAARLEIELHDSRMELVAAEDALQLALGIADQGGCAGVSGTGGCGRTCPADAQLAGRCVLCIGGMTRLVDGYRKLVEVRGGRFLHHDGGQEDNLHRIDAAVASADAVVCQAGCVSHAAYYRLKEACKKLGKPCIFVQSPGVGSFARSLATLSDKGGFNRLGCQAH